MDFLTTLQQYKKPVMVPYSIKKDGVMGHVLVEATHFFMVGSHRFHVLPRLKWKLNERLEPFLLEKQPSQWVVDEALSGKAVCGLWETTRVKAYQAAVGYLSKRCISLENLTNTIRRGQSEIGLCVGTLPHGSNVCIFYEPKEVKPEPEPVQFEAVPQRKVNWHIVIPTILEEVSPC